MQPKVQVGGCGWGAWALGPTPCAAEAVACRIQCPAILAALATLLGAVLSFTCIPASTKGAKTDAQAPLPGKPRQVHPAQMLGQWKALARPACSSQGVRGA